MRILWVCNICIAEISEHLHKPNVAIGGWLSGMAQMILNGPFDELIICYPDNSNYSGEVNNQLRYYSFSRMLLNYDKGSEKRFE